MKKQIFFLLLCLGWCFIAVAQDVIVLKNGNETQAKVTEIGLDEIKYKKFSNLDGPTYTLQKSEVFMIKYENGDKDFFGLDNATAEEETEIVEDAEIPSVLIAPNSPDAPSDCAILHLYRPGGMGTAVSYDVYLDDELLCRMKNNSWATVKIYDEGARQLSAKTETTVRQPIDIVAGETYFIRCGIKMGIVAGRPTFQIVPAERGEAEFLKVQEKGKPADKIKEDNAPEPTVEQTTAPLEEIDPAVSKEESVKTVGQTEPTVSAPDTEKQTLTPRRSTTSVEKGEITSYTSDSISWEIKNGALYITADSILGGSIDEKKGSVTHNLDYWGIPFDLFQNAFSMIFGRNTPVIITEGTTCLGEGAFGFFNCSSIELPASLESIGKGAFFSCNKLTEINIPANVKEIGEVAFALCDNLEAINVAEENEYFTSIDGVLYDKDLTTLIQIPDAKKGTVQIPETVVEICDFAAMTFSLKDLYVPWSVPPQATGKKFGNNRGSKHKIERLHIPAGYKDAYKNANWTKYFKKIVEIR
jgi:hypothetical protein